VERFPEGEAFRRSYEELLSLLVQYGMGRILGEISRMSPSYGVTIRFFPSSEEAKAWLRSQP
jgi:hypothetical protein